MFKFSVITLSHPAEFGMVTLYMPLLVNTCPFGAVYALQELGLMVEKVVTEQLFNRAILFLPVPL
jgi:hypothetical protein